ncbi:hypothetical protein HZA55_08250, partial [Candidatus Poribacteria bacterium]|nr:hypothetical protein [Candidatus Poribacteria bacterium]
KQMDISKKQLEADEDSLNKFSRENSLDLIKQEIQDNLEKLSTNKKLLTTVKLEADELRYKLDQFKKEAENNNLFLSSPLAESDAFYQELKKKLINLDISLAETKQNFSEHHPKYQEIHITIEKTKEKISEVIHAAINNYEFKLNNLEDKEKILRETISNAEKNILNFQTKMAEYELKFDRLQRNQKLAAQSYTMLATKIEEVKIEDKVHPTLMKIIEYAVTPQSPTKPRILRNVGLFSILGFFTAIFLAFIKEYFED